MSESPVLLMKKKEEVDPTDHKVNEYTVVKSLTRRL